jgi:hypothetical protein
MDYDVQLIHKPGKTMIPADALSRRHDHSVRIEIKEDIIGLSDNLFVRLIEQPLLLDEAIKTVLMLSEVMYADCIFPDLQNCRLVMYSYCKIADQARYEYCIFSGLQNCRSAMYLYCKLQTCNFASKI